MVNIIEQSNGVKKVTIQTPYEGVTASINSLTQTVAGKADKTDVNGKANQSDLDATNEQLAENTTHRTEWLNVKQPPYNTPTNGTSDDSIAIQNAINDVLDGGVVYIPKASNPYLLKTPITKDNKSFTLIIEGTLKDGIASWTENFNDTTLTGKGLLAFGHGSITIIGTSGFSLDGNTGVAALKKFLYLFECNGVYVSNVNGINHTDSAIIGIGCTDVIHRDCKYDGGQYTILWSRGKNYTIDNVRVTNGKYNGIVVHDRGAFNSSVYATIRPSNVKILHCRTYNLTGSNAYVVGITADSCDDITIHGNIVDGNNVGTMAYSFASSTGGQVYGNRAKNFTNTANGTTTYAGIGMECDTVKDIEFFGNTFSECLIGYLVLYNTNCKYDGIYHCETAKTQALSTSAGEASMFAFGNVISQSKTIHIDNCICDGGNHFISGQILVDGLFIKNVDVHDTFDRIVKINTGAVLSTVEIDGMSVSLSGNAKTVLNFSDNVLSDIRVRNLRAKATTSPNTSQRLFYGAKSGGKYRFSSIHVENYDEGINCPYDIVSELIIENSSFTGVSGSLMIIGNTTNTAFTNNKLNGVRVKDQGNNAPIVFGTSAPTTIPKFIGQKFMDTTNKKSYEAFGITASTDWAVLN